jgi:hypothetical protein
MGIPGSDIRRLAVSIDQIRPCMSAEQMQRVREEIVRDASHSFRAAWLHRQAVRQKTVSQLERTHTLIGTDAEGKPVDSTYDKQ